MLETLRRNGVPVGIALVWCALVGVSVWAPGWGVGDAMACRFRAVTGVPCATCGSTRAAAALVRGDVVGALVLNPWVTVVMVGVPVWMLARRTREPVWAWTHSRAVWAVMGVGLAVNWAYVVMVER